MSNHPEAVTLAADPGSGAVQFVTRRVPDGGGVQLALGYRRSHDFDPRDDPGQDHAVVRAGGGRVVGVVADGVSQSFFGDIAARCVAEGLAGYLWRHAARPPAAQAVAHELARLRADARHEVETRAIPTDVPELARAGLERLRGTTGSQAVFAAFVFDTGKGVAHVYTVGDAAAVLHGAGGRPGTVVAVDPAGRWSTHGAPPLRLRADRYAGVSAVVARSDGARGWGDVLAGHDDEEAFREEAEQLAGYDDVAFVSARVEDAAVSAAGVPTLEASTGVEQLPGDGPERAPAPLVALAAAAAQPVPARPSSLPAESSPSPREARGPARRLRLSAELRQAAATAAVVVLGLTVGVGAGKWWRARDSGPPADVPKSSLQPGPIPTHVAPSHPTPVHANAPAATVDPHGSPDGGPLPGVVPRPGSEGTLTDDRQPASPGGATAPARNPPASGPAPGEAAPPVADGRTERIPVDLESLQHPRSQPPQNGSPRPDTHGHANTLPATRPKTGEKDRPALTPPPPSRQRTAPPARQAQDRAARKTDPRTAAAEQRRSEGTPQRAEPERRPIDTVPDPTPGTTRINVDVTPKPPATTNPVATREP